MKKYKLTKNTKQVNGITLYQIQAVRDFSFVREGDMGGWVEFEENLTQNGNAWVYDDAWVSGNAHVYGNARVLSGSIKASGNIIYDLLNQCFVAPINNKVTLWKKVNKIRDGVYASCYDSNFKYYDGQISKVMNPDLSDASCSSGIHLSYPNYWTGGDTIIACEVDVKDIITVQQGKVRCKKCKTIGEVSYDM